MRAPLLVLCLALLASGCGEEGRRENSTPLGGGLGIKLETSPSPPVSGEDVTWTLVVENDGVEAIELTFGSAQRADVILRRDGKQVYRWGSGRFFTTAVDEERLLPNRKLRFELKGPLKVRPGRYDLEARLTAKPKQEPLRRSIDIQEK